MRAVFATYVVGQAAAISDVCQAKMDEFCAQDCYPKIQSRPCDGPMYARQSGPSGNAYRCYSPSTLNDDNATYHSGTCYCTRDSQLSGILDECASGITSSRVFSNGVPSGVCYRIPAVVQTKSGALVAFAESRHGGCGDGQVREIAVTTSKDEGQTWSDVTYAVTQPTSSGNVGNPMPFALSDGRVALTYVFRNSGGAAVGSGDGIVFSSDDGATWSEPQDISSGFGDVKGSMPGPGAGIQLDTGRLLLVSHYGAYVDDYVTYSDDQGATWTTVDHKFPGMDEATMADLGGGNVLLNFRHRDEKTRGRAFSRSSDGGLTWSDISYDSALIGPVCQGSLAAIGSSVYFSNPASTSGRNHLTVKKSEDGGNTWSASHEVQSGTSAGYSSLVQGTVQDEEHGGIVYESTSAGCIDFKTFPLAMSSHVLV